MTRVKLFASSYLLLISIISMMLITNTEGQMKIPGFPT